MSQEQYIETVLQYQKNYGFNNVQAILIATRLFNCGIKPTRKAVRDYIVQNDLAVKER